MSGYVTIKRGRVAIVHCRLAIDAADINAEVGEPSGTFMSIYETNRRRIDWLCNDNALIEYQRHAEEIARAGPNDPPHEWAISFVRPWDGSPIAGPLMICALRVSDGVHLPLSDAECVRYYDALTLFGYQPEG